MSHCSCPRYNIPDARPLSPGDCPVHAPYPWEHLRRLLDQVGRERVRQDEKWGYPQPNTLTQWISFIAEELGEAAQLANDLELRDRLAKHAERRSRVDKNLLCEELVQVAALALAAVQHIEEGHV